MFCCSFFPRVCRKKQAIIRFFTQHLFHLIPVFLVLSFNRIFGGPATLSARLTGSKETFLGCLGDLSVKHLKLNSWSPPTELHHCLRHCKQGSSITPTTQPSFSSLTPTPNLPASFLGLSSEDVKAAFLYPLFPPHFVAKADLEHPILLPLAPQVPGSQVCTTAHSFLIPLGWQLQRPPKWSFLFLK